MQRTYEGKCPHRNNIHAISVEYRYVPILGQTKRNYKKAQFQCEYYNECQDDNCPIYSDAVDFLSE